MQISEAKSLAFLYRACGAEHCTVLHFNADQLSKVASASFDVLDTAKRRCELYLKNHRWRGDPMIAEARQQLAFRQASIIRAAVREFSDADFRELALRPDRHRRAAADFVDVPAMGSSASVSCVGLGGSAPSRATTSLASRISASLMLAMLGKHIGLIWQRPELSLALTSLTEIEACIAAAPVALSRREAEVCARISRRACPRSAFRVGACDQ